MSRRTQAPPRSSSVFSSEERGAARDRTGEVERDPESVAREIVLRRLTASAQTRSQLAQALAGKGIEQEVADKVLDRMQEVGLIDDRAYAEAWVRERGQGKAIARRALALELRRKGIDDDLAREVLADVDADDEYAAAVRLVRDRWPRLGALTAEARERRLFGQLARRGHGPGVARRAVLEVAAEDRDASQAEGSEPVDLA